MKSPLLLPFLKAKRGHALASTHHSLSNPAPFLPGGARKLTLRRRQIRVPIPNQKHGHIHAPALLVVLAHSHDIVVVPRGALDRRMQARGRLERAAGVQAEDKGKRLGVLDLVPQHGRVGAGPHLQQLDRRRQPRDVHQLAAAPVVVQGRLRLRGGRGRAGAGAGPAAAGRAAAVGRCWGGDIVT